MKKEYKRRVKYNSVGAEFRRAVINDSILELSKPKQKGQKHETKRTAR